jgi:hypothetical protein
MKLFTIQGNLVFMNNFYHKVALAFACTALSCALGANEEAKAATFNGSYPYPWITFQVLDGGSSGRDGLGDAVYNTIHPNPEGGLFHSWQSIERTTARETAALTEFSIRGLASYITSYPYYRNDIKITKIINAALGIQVWHWPPFDYPSRPLGLFGYIGNGIAEASDFEAGVFLDSITFSEEEGEYSSVYFNVTAFLDELVSGNNEFAGFAVRPLSESQTFFRHPEDRVFPPPTLHIEGEYEVVPEPTTIFGSAIGLCLGGWLKRKKSILQNKAKSQA